jgi:hypothetical protein|tara:strand:- start:70 stop:171 length:102 start_codon:yes stop_codon:yes gene_type:complete
MNDNSLLIMLAVSIAGAGVLILFTTIFGVISYG